MTDDPPSFDRPRGLTNGNRRFIATSGSEVEPEKRRMHWHRIRERVRSVTKDFSLLFDQLPDKQLNMIFDPDSYEEDSEEWRAVRDGMFHAIGLFFYSGYTAENDLPPELVVRLLVRDGLEEALKRQGLELPPEEFEFQYETEHITEEERLNELATKWRDGESLTYQEFQFLQHEGTTYDLTEDAVITRGDSRYDYEVQDTTEDGPDSDPSASGSSSETKED